MQRIFLYSLYDMIRNRWMLYYTGFFLLLTCALLTLSSDFTQITITLTNVILSLTPLIGILFGCIYYFSSKEFIELLLTQPIKRKSVFAGIYLGLAVSLSISLVGGVLIPLTVSGHILSNGIQTLLLLLLLAIVLSIVFSLFAFIVCIRYDNKIKAFGISILLWLFFALLYDGIFLLLLMYFKEYPLEKLSTVMSILNPIDLTRILIIFKLDISAMMGFSGAVIKKFFGSNWGTVLISISLFLWVVLSFWTMLRLASRKDF